MNIQSNGTCYVVMVEADLLPTLADIDRAKQAAAKERRRQLERYGLLIDADGRLAKPQMAAASRPTT